MWKRYCIVVNLCNAANDFKQLIRLLNQKPCVRIEETFQVGSIENVSGTKLLLDMPTSAIGVGRKSGKDSGMSDTGSVKGTPLCPPCVRQPTHSQPSPHWQVPVASSHPGSTISCQKYEDGESVGVSSSFTSSGLSIKIGLCGCAGGSVFVSS